MKSGEKKKKKLGHFEHKNPATLNKTLSWDQRRTPFMCSAHVWDEMSGCRCQNMSSLIEMDNKQCLPPPPLIKSGIYETWALCVGCKITPTPRVPHRHTRLGGRRPQVWTFSAATSTVDLCSLCSSVGYQESERCKTANTLNRMMDSA